MRTRLGVIAMVIVLTAVAFYACGGATDAPVEPTIPVDESGFPIDWPIATPPGTVNGCENGTVTQDSSLFSVVLCLADEPDPFTASQQYLAELEADGFIEREPGSFLIQQQTFLDGNGIEIYYQLVDNEATIVLIKPG